MEFVCESVILRGFTWSEI